MLLAPVSSEVAFWHGMDRLVGDVVLPPWPGPHPAVLVARSPMSSGLPCSWQRRLAGAGFASFAYDPAGVGRSTGDWRRQAVGDRASEVLAARQVLGARADVGDQVALLALGEAGWAGIRVQASLRPFAALVLLSTSVLEPVAVEQYRLGRRLERHGVPSDQIGIALALLRERFRRLSDGIEVDQVLAAEGACATAPWYPLMPRLAVEDVPLMLRLVGVDPAPELAAVACPVLAMHGAGDLSQPVQRNADTVLAALRAAEHVDHASVLVPDADHELRDETSQVAPGVHELVVTWLDRRLARTGASAAGPVEGRADGRPAEQPADRPAGPPSVRPGDPLSGPLPVARAAARPDPLSDPLPPPPPVTAAPPAPPPAPAAPPVPSVVPAAASLFAPAPSVAPAPAPAAASLFEPVQAASASPAPLPPAVRPAPPAPPPPGPGGPFAGGPFSAPPPGPQVQQAPDGYPFDGRTAHGDGPDGHGPAVLGGFAEPPTGRRVATPSEPFRRVLDVRDERPPGDTFAHVAGLDGSMPDRAMPHRGMHDVMPETLPDPLPGEDGEPGPLFSGPTEMRLPFTQMMPVVFPLKTRP